MSWTGSARDEILLSIRRQLHGVRGSLARPAVAQAGSRSPGAPASMADPAARLARFREMLESVGGHTYPVRDEKAASASLAGIIERTGAREIALSDSPLVRRLAAGLAPGVKTFDGWRERRRIFECDLGFSGAQWGIAETGTLVLDSSQEKHRLVSLVPPVHVAILETRTLLMTLGDAFAAARARPGGLTPTLTLVTGPSRTADIELTLVVGVHGPRELHVLLLEGPRP
jgi:L-lactate dehydrogenase complex protein LldG